MGVAEDRHVEGSDHLGDCGAVAAGADLSRNELIERFPQQHEIGQLPIRPGAVAGGLVETVHPHAPQAELVRRGDVVEEARSDMRMPGAWGVGAGEELLPVTCPGLYEPISCATTTSSNATPIRTCDAAMKSSSVFERIASRQPRRRSSSREWAPREGAPARQRVGQAMLGAGRRAELPHRFREHLAVGEGAVAPQLRLDLVIAPQLVISTLLAEYAHELGADASVPVDQRPVAVECRPPLRMRIAQLGSTRPPWRPRRPVSKDLPAVLVQPVLAHGSRAAPSTSSQKRGPWLCSSR